MMASMAAERQPQNHDPIEERPSGVPGPHKLGDSKNEAIALAVAIAVLILIVLGFWYEAR
jgi:hypothetical protein